MVRPALAGAPGSTGITPTPFARPTADRDVPDPFYGGDDGFTHVLRTVERTADAIVAALEQELGGS